MLNDATDLPLAGALVEIRELGLRMTTGENGAFSFEIPAKYTRVRVRISKEGFELKTEDPTLGTGHFEVYQLKEKRE